MSVLNQTYTCLECIVVDDASTDNTPAVVQGFDDPRLVYLRHESNRRASAARNTGIAQSQGALIAFLDDDDEWVSYKLEKQVPLLQSLPDDYGMVYSWMDYYDHSGQIIYEVHSTHHGYIFPLVLDRQRIGGCPTLVVRREIVEEVGGFDENLPRGNDGDFIRRVCLHYKVDHVPEVLVKVHVQHGHERISQMTERSIRHAIRGQSTKLEKFADVLPRYPKQTAAIHARLAYHYSQLDEWEQCLRHYWSAFKIYPLSRALLRSLLRTIKYRFTRLARP